MPEARDKGKHKAKSVDSICADIMKELMLEVTSVSTVRSVFTVYGDHLFVSSNKSYVRNYNNNVQKLKR